MGWQSVFWRKIPGGKAMSHRRREACLVALA
jgi:hypothetical protein